MTGDVMRDWAARDTVILMIGIALAVAIATWGLWPRRWVDRAASELDWLLERVKRLFGG